jgi:hypothetical protein
MGNFLNSTEAASISAVATDVWPYLLGRVPDITVEGYSGSINPKSPLDTLRKEISAAGTGDKGTLLTNFNGPGLEWFNASNIPNLEFGFELYLGNALSKWRTDPYSLRMIHVLVAMARMRLLRQYLTINGISSPRIHCMEWGLARGWRTGAPSAQGRCNHSEIAWGNALGGICDGMCKIPGLDSHAMYDWVARASSVDPPAGAQSSFGIISSDELTVSKAYQSLCVANGAASPTNPPYGSWYSVGTDAGVAPDLD